MGIARGTNIVRDGLVFGYDTGYGVADNSTATRFYPGEPTTNYVTTNLETLGTDGSGQSSIGTRTTIAPNHVKIVDINSNTRQSHLISGLTGGTIYIVSIQFKKIEGTPTFRFQLQDYNGGSYLRTIKFTTTAEAGLEDKYGWQTASYSFALGSDANAVRIWWQDGADYTTYTHSFELKNPQLEAKNHVTPYVSGTRSATQSLIDLTRTTNIDVSNVSFDSTGQLTFDGTDDEINTGITTQLTDFSCVVIFKDGGSAAWGRLVDKQYTNGFFISSYFLSVGTNYVGAGVIEPSSPHGQALQYTTGKYNYFVLTRSGSTHTIYLNGSTNKLQKTNGSSSTLSSTEMAIGAWNGSTNSQRYTGEIPVVKLYNKELTAAEIQQDFKAYKNRFNL